MKFKYNERYRYIEFKQRRKHSKTIIWLTETESKLFKILQTGQVITYTELIKIKYKVEDDKFYKKNINTDITRMRQKLKYFGKIVNVRNIGYRLEIYNE